MLPLRSSRAGWFTGQTLFDSQFFVYHDLCSPCRCPYGGRTRYHLLTTPRSANDAWFNDIAVDVGDSFDNAARHRAAVPIPSRSDLTTYRPPCRYRRVWFCLPSPHTTVDAASDYRTIRCISPVGLVYRLSYCILHYCCVMHRATWFRTRRTAA